MEPVDLGQAWTVDAFGCDPALLRSKDALAAAFDAIVSDVGLKPLFPATWHVFPGEGGVTGFLLLSESHLSVHTFPEHGFAAFDLYCCRERDDWPWARHLADRLGAREVTVRRLRRGTLPA